MKKIIKYSLIGLAAVIVMASLSYNGFVFYKGYTNTLQTEAYNAGYTQAIQLLDQSLARDGKVVLNRADAEGVTETIVLVPEKAK